MSKQVELTISDASLAIIRDGQKALKWLDKDEPWKAWVRVGKAVVEVRAVAMRLAEVNTPYGPKYRPMFGRLMQQYKFTEGIKDKAVRSRLVEVMENLEAIEVWRNDLTEEQRRRWNHPQTVLERYKADLRKATATDDDDMFKAPTAKEKIRELKSEVHQLRKGASLPWGSHDSAADKARAIMEHLSIVEAEELGLALLQAAKVAREPAPEVIVTKEPHEQNVA